MKPILLNSFIGLFFLLTQGLFAAPTQSGKPANIFTNDVPESEALKPEPKSVERESASESKAQSHPQPEISKRPEPVRISQALSPEENSNLPSYYTRNPNREVGAGLVLTPTRTREALPVSVAAGKEFPIEISHSILAFLDESTPVIARVTGGPLRGASFIGKSRLDRSSERVFVDFTVVNIGTQEYSLKATLVDETGQSALRGEFYSKELIYASADFVSMFMAAYFDAQVPRTRNVFGQETTDTSVDTAVKKGLSGSSLAAAERFREKLKNAEAFCEIKGPILGRAIVISANRNSN